MGFIRRRNVILDLDGKAIFFPTNYKNTQHTHVAVNRSFTNIFSAKKRLERFLLKTINITKELRSLLIFKKLRQHTKKTENAHKVLTSDRTKQKFHNFLLVKNLHHATRRKISSYAEMVKTIHNKEKANNTFTAISRRQLVKTLLKSNNKLRTIFGLINKKYYQVMTTNLPETRSTVHVIT